MPRPATGQIVVERRASGTTYALRFRADGKRRYETLGTAAEGWTPARAEEELQNRMADVRRGRWQPPAVAPIVETPKEEPTFHVLASEWVASREHEVDERTVENWK